MARLDIERQKRLEPTRIEYAVSRIQEIGALRLFSVTTLRYSSFTKGKQ